MTTPETDMLPFLRQPESRRLEFKESFPKGDQVAITTVAFANGAGGRIVFGVKDEPRTIAGIADDRLFQLEERVANAIFDRCAPDIVPETYIQSAGGKALLVVEVYPGSQKPYYLKKLGKERGTYIRVGSTNRRASAETIAALERERRRISFDSLTVHNVAADDLDLSGFIAAYAERTGKALTRKQLANLGLFHTERDAVWPTHAAVLLAEGPVSKRLFPYAKVECARFKGTTRSVFLDQASIDAPIFAAVEPCMAFIKKNIALGATIGEIYREERWEYPLEAIREALVNAVIHRDYAILGSDIKVAIYDDMLEITSPGPLPDTLPIDELGRGRSEIRNRVLAPIFKALRLIEAWGSGIQKMRKELEDYPEIGLELKEVGQAFQAQFIKKDSSLQPDSQPESRPESQPESRPGSLPDRVLKCLAGGPLSKAELAATLGQKGISGQLNKVVRELLVKGKIEYTIPGKPNSRKQRYRLKVAT